MLILTPKKRILFALLPFITLISCYHHVLFEKNVRIKEHRWNISDTVEFVINIPDTASFYDLFVNVRNGGLYEYSNLFVFINIESPTGFEITDTLEILLADNKGKWYGRGLGDIKALSSPYKKNVRFSLPGIYKFKIIHGMRTNELNQIFDIGIRIAKAQKNNS